MGTIVTSGDILEDKRRPWKAGTVVAAQFQSKLLIFCLVFHAIRWVSLNNFHRADGLGQNPGKLFSGTQSLVKK